MASSNGNRLHSVTTTKPLLGVIGMIIVTGIVSTALLAIVLYS